MKPPADSKPPDRVWAEWTLIAVFLALLWLPTLDTWLNIDKAPKPRENRLPAPKPRLLEISFRGLQNYQTGWEAYFDDHYGFRKQLIRWFQRWKTSYKVMVGQNGWLYWAKDEMIENYLGMTSFPPDQLQAWQRLLEKRRDWLAARGIKYLFVIPPDKHTVYPEFLPVWLLNATATNRETKLDQFLKYMKAHSTVEILDLRQPLIEAKKIAPVYLKNDTHWNAFGGFVASQEVIKTLSKQVPDLPPLRLEDFNWRNAPAAGGDLARIIGSDAPEKNYFIFTPKPAVITPLVYVATNIISMWDPHRINVISETRAPLTETAVIFHDSFGNVWQQFLDYSFKRIVFISEDREFNTQVILAYHPRIVVNEILERNFNMLDPLDLMEHDGLP